MSSSGTRRLSGRALAVLALLVALGVAGVGSYYASSHPDGLEFVAGEQGFDAAAEDPKTADGPFADYQTKGVEDSRVGGGLAGVVGVLLVLGIGGGLFYVLRRHPADETDHDSATRS